MIRPYKADDYHQIIQLFEFNTPEYFAAEEKDDLEKYLVQFSDHFFVFEEEKQIIGAGGYNIIENQGRLSWYFIHPHHRGKGIGKSIAQHSLDCLQKEEGIDHIIVRTSQHAWQFFEKMGFQLEKMEKDFWAPGFDLYQMQLP